MAQVSLDQFAAASLDHPPHAAADQAVDVADALPENELFRGKARAVPTQMPRVAAPREAFVRPHATAGPAELATPLATHFRRSIPP